MSASYAASTALAGRNAPRKRDGTLARPWTRATSSTKSMWRCRSARNDGTSQVPSASSVRPRRPRISPAAVREIEPPINCASLPASSATGRVSAGGSPATWVVASAVPPAVSRMSFTASAEAGSTPDGSTPRSKRYDESEVSAVRRDVRRMPCGVKYADSSRISVVAAVTPLCRPPITPARASAAPDASEISKSSAVRTWADSSSARNASPSVAWRTTMPPVRLAASKACSGWPSSCSTKLVTSTMLLIGRRPMASSRCLSQAGLSLIEDAGDSNSGVERAGGGGVEADEIRGRDGHARLTGCPVV